MQLNVSTLKKIVEFSTFGDCEKKKYGKLVADFLIIQHKNALHVCNAPSPAATASLESSQC